MLIHFLACSLTAFGPSLAIVILWIGKKPLHLLLSLARYKRENSISIPNDSVNHSAFYWTLLILVLASLQLGLQASQTTLSIYTGILQELGRICLYFLIDLIRPLLIKISPVDAASRPSSPMIHTSYDTSCAFGVAFMSALVQYIQPLFQTTGYEIRLIFLDWALWVVHPVLK